MIQTAVSESVRTITLDRPDSRNALTPAALTDLERTIVTAEEPVLYLTGRGEAFCAGADLDVVAALDSRSATTLARQGQRVATALETYDGAVVAGIDGPARGGGVELALACDLRIATPAATFAESGVSLGLFGAWGWTARLPRVVGEGAALDIALSGRVLNASEAKEMGLCSRIVEEPRDVAVSLTSNDPKAMRVIKERIRDDSGIAEQEAREREAFATLVETREGAP